MMIEQFLFGLVCAIAVSGTVLANAYVPKKDRRFLPDDTDQLIDLWRGIFPTKQQLEDRQVLGINPGVYYTKKEILELRRIKMRLILRHRDDTYFQTALKEYEAQGWTKATPVTYAWGEHAVTMYPPDHMLGDIKC